MWVRINFLYFNTKINSILWKENLYNIHFFTNISDTTCKLQIKVDKIEHGGSIFAENALIKLTFVCSYRIGYFRL